MLDFKPDPSKFGKPIVSPPPPKILKQTAKEKRQAERAAKNAERKKLRAQAKAERQAMRAQRQAARAQRQAAKRAARGFNSGGVVSRTGHTDYRNKGMFK